MPLHSLSIIFIRHCLFGMVWISNASTHSAKNQPFMNVYSQFNTRMANETTISIMNLQKAKDFSMARKSDSFKRIFVRVSSHVFFFLFNGIFNNFVAKSADSMTTIVTLSKVKYFLNLWHFENIQTHYNPKEDSIFILNPLRIQYFVANELRIVGLGEQYYLLILQCNLQPLVRVKLRSNCVFVLSIANFALFTKNRMLDWMCWQEVMDQGGGEFTT